jgi:hypothetical protein
MRSAPSPPYSDYRDQGVLDAASVDEAPTSEECMASVVKILTYVVTILALLVVLTVYSGRGGVRRCELYETTLHPRPR